jgi:hypothetical protein
VKTKEEIDRICKAASIKALILTANSIEQRVKRLERERSAYLKEIEKRLMGKSPKWKYTEHVE